MAPSAQACTRISGPLFSRQLVSMQDPGEDGLVAYLVDSALTAARGGMPAWTGGGR